MQLKMPTIGIDDRNPRSIPPDSAG